MIRLLLFLVLITFEYCFCSVNSQNKLSLGHLQQINKCCPVGECVGRRKICVKSPIALNFSETTIYTENLYDSGMSFEDVFNLTANKFKDIEFHMEAINVNLLDNFNLYVIESGELLMEIPNAYNRWTPIQPDHYCVDCRYYSSKPTESKPVFWAKLPQMEPDDRSHSPTPIMYEATFISCFFLLLVLIVYMLLPELRNLSGVILMAYVISLFTAFLLLGVMQTKLYTALVCICLTMGIYFSFLASFFWMNVMAFDVWWTIRGYAKGRKIHRRGERFKFLMYCLYAFGVPMLMTLGLFLLNTYSSQMRTLPWFVTPHVPEYGCFLEGGVKLLYLYVPMLILILINCIFYLMTGYNVLRLRRKLVSTSTITYSVISKAHHTHKQRFRDYLKLSVMMGLNWILEVISFMYPGVKLWLISDFYNVLFGLVLFIIFICNKKVFNSLRDRFRRKKIGNSCTTVNTIESESQAADIFNRK